MYRYLLATGGAMLLAAAASNAQPMRASIVGNGDPNSGRCTVQVVVDGAATIEINGTNANLRDVSGSAPQWRRFECTGPMPANAANLRFRPLEGRGRQQLIRDPRNGGSAVVRVEDPEAGADSYSFELTWSGGGPQYSGQQYGRPEYRDQQQYGPGPAMAGGRWTQDQAVRACREDVRGRAAERYGSNIRFGDMRMEDNPDRRDWVVGSFTTPQDGQMHRFACSVNFDSGNVRWAQIDPPGGRFGSGSAERYSPRQAAVQNCQSAVAQRMRDRGLGEIRFGETNVDPDGDWVRGQVWGDRGYGDRPFAFSCRVEPNDGDVRSVDLNRQQ